MADPKCPDCGIAGIEHIVSADSTERSRTRSPWFVVIHCDACGHVYDVITKHVFEEKAPIRFVIPKGS
jgi:uncharacterized Zn finger protein